MICIKLVSMNNIKSYGEKGRGRREEWREGYMHSIVYVVYIIYKSILPLPEMLNVSSTGMRKGLSVSLLGVGIDSSTASINARIA